MIKSALLGAATAAAALAFAAPASAAFIDAPVPTNAYITFGGLDWAWASPCGPFESCGDIDLSYQSTQGWRLPTAAEFANRPSALDFVFAGANVPVGGIDPVSNARFQAGTPPGAAACATPYFSSIYLHCDWYDGENGFIWNPGLPGGQGVPETWVVRGASEPVVPEPGTWAMLIAGFGMIGAAARRRRIAVAA